MKKFKQKKKILFKLKNKKSKNYKNMKFIQKISYYNF